MERDWWDRGRRLREADASRHTDNAESSAPTVNTPVSSPLTLK